MDQLSIAIDHQQRRVKNKPVLTSVDYLSWDTTLGDGGAVLWPYGDAEDGYMAILRPRCWEPSWRTSVTTPYDKYGVSDFTGLTGAKWTTYDHTGTGGGKTLFTTDSTANAEAGKTSLTLGQNRGVYIGFYCYGEGSDREYLRCGYGSTTAYTSGLGFRIYSGGRIDVYKNGTFIDTVNLVGSGRGQNLDAKYVEIIILPARKRELWFYCNQGGVGKVTFDDIDMTPTEPEITPDTYFWFQYQGATPAIQFAPLKFNTSGTIYGQKSAFKRGPATTAAAYTFTNTIFTGITNALILGHRQVPGSANNNVTAAALRDGTDAGAFTPNGTNKDCRVKLTLSGSGSYTPMIYGAMMGYQCEQANTPASATNLNPYLLKTTIAVPEDPGDVSLDITLKKPAAIEAAGASKLRTIANRPMRVRLGSNLIIEGRSSNHTWEDGEQDEIRRFHMTIRDQWKLLETTIFDDPIPLDGYTLTNALIFILKYCGIGLTVAGAADPAQYDIDVTTLPFSDVPTDGEPNFMIKAGDSAAEVITQLMRDNAGTWFYGFKPYDNGAGGVKIKFFAKAPSSLGTSPKLTLYPTLAAATAAGISAADARRFVYRSFSEEVVEPEGNEMYLTGIDYATGRPLVAARRDTASIEPTTAVSLRPDNWYGEPLTIGDYNPALSSNALLDGAADILEDRLFTFRRLPNWGCEMLFYTGASGAKVPVWRGDVVRLKDVAAIAGNTDYRIRCFDGEFQFEPADGTISNGQIRPFTYAGEQI
jgi:hypothetical protein